MPIIVHMIMFNLKIQYEYTNPKVDYNKWVIQ